ncbi:MAG: (deoxy)nucleoside triphosphate pyrophosphohydrolase [Lachnospiraceae bacterium]|nr:(deoxy)nucleoside triphosphate pyrophosphohydrolase [Lachnospiraceae bacterium]
MEKKTVKVVAAVIIATKILNNAEEKIVFATQRGYGEYKDGWEFPGGKIEDGKSPQEALKREIKEELDITINVGQLIQTIEYDYSTFHLSMDCFVCEIMEGAMVLKEHEAAKWLTKNSLYSVDWLPADRLILEDIEKLL